jgi:PAS domain S-box-containing protein
MNERKILLIDDEESIRTLLSLSLRQKGYQVFTAEDGIKGIEVFEKERPSIVITDIKMPGIDGITVLKKIRNLDPDTRVIVVTGHGDMESAIEALVNEASDFINKPIKDEQLSIALKRAEEVLWMKQKLREYTTNLEIKIKEATEELRKTYLFQKNLIQSSIDGIIATDREGIITLFNKGAEEILGYSSEEVVGKIHIDSTAPPGVPDVIKKEFMSNDWGGRNRLVNYETKMLTKDGEEIPVRISGTILFDEGKAIGLVFFFQDLREIKRLQKELIQRERLSAIGQTMAGMAHYIKNILNGLEGGMYMVNTGLKRGKEQLLRRGWDMVQGNVSKISDLVMNMLTYSRDREPEPEECDPKEVVNEVFLLMEQKARKHGIKMVQKVAPEIRRCFLDRGIIHRALLNLINNAIDACVMDKDRNKTWEVIVKGVLDNEMVRFDVIDNGIGIKDEIKEKIFDRFFSTKGSKGSGFGLIVTKKIVEEHRGKITFESEPGKGSRFSIFLPYNPV